jgi:prophage antirepressor-like protein
VLDLTLVYPETRATVRVLGSPEAPSWVAADVCAVLGLTDTSKTVENFADDEKGTSTVRTPGGPQEVLTVTEPGLYRLIFKSRKPSAERFRRWVCHDVLPAIRRTGTYTVPQAPPPPAALPKTPTELRIAAMDLWRFSLSLGPVPTPMELLEFRDASRNLTLDMTGTRTVDELTVSGRCQERGVKATPAEWSRIGRFAAELYRSRHGRAPERSERLVGGAVRQLFVYSRADVGILDEAIDVVLRVVPAMAAGANDRRPALGGAA